MILNNKVKNSNKEIVKSVSPTNKDRKSRSLYTKKLRILNPHKKLIKNKNKFKIKDIHGKKSEARARNMILKFKRELLKEKKILITKRKGQKMRATKKAKLIGIKGK